MSDASAKRRGLPLRVKMRHEPHFVEELAGRDAMPVGKMVPLSALQPDPDQPRAVMGDLSPLVSSIKAKGVLEPILVRPVGASTEERQVERYRIISGERRYRAAREAGLFEVPVIEMDVGEEEALEIALIENLQRKDLTPFEEADGYRALAERYGYTHDEIANTVAKSRTVITEALGLLKIPRRVRNAVEALGIQSKTVLRELLKAGDEDGMIALAEEIAERGLNRDDLRAQHRGAAATHRSGPRRKPYRFKFRAPDKSFNLSLTFRRSTVEKDDLISALEQILQQLREAEDQ